MPIYRWQKEYEGEDRRSGTVVAQQINSLQDMESWIAELTPTDLDGKFCSFRDLEPVGIEDGKWVLSIYMIDRPMGEEGTQTWRYELGSYLYAVRLDPDNPDQFHANVTFEIAEHFERRFEPVPDDPGE